jgi:hypothetical protein
VAEGVIAQLLAPPNVPPLRATKRAAPSDAADAGGPSPTAIDALPALAPAAWPRAEPFASAAAGCHRLREAAALLESLGAARARADK